MSHPISKGRMWTARILSGVVILYMLLGSISNFLKPDFVVEGTLALGFAEHHIFTLGILGFLFTLLYAIPRTSFLGALLLTGMFGGAVATHIRLDDPLFTTLLPVVFAILTWAGIWLRNDKLRKMILMQNVDA